MTCFDLHIHSALSACGEDTMSPRRILARARSAGLNMVAVTDHNASVHSAMTCGLAAEYGLAAVPAVEVTSREEVHLLAYFPDPERLQRFQSVIDDALPELENNVEFFGWQAIYDENDEIVDLDRRLRHVGTALGLTALVREVHRLSGRAVPAHVFRARFSLTSQLGFIDPEGEFDGLEVEPREWRRRRLQMGARESGFPLITGSDSHFLEDIGRCFMKTDETATTLPELASALFDRQGSL